MKIKLRKREVNLKWAPQISDLLGGCYGCFFCRVRGGYYRQTCASYKNIIGDCGNFILTESKEEKK